MTETGEIVVVDVHEPNLAVYAKVLSKIDGVMARCFTDPAAALTWAKGRLPVLVITDQAMPDRGSLEFLKLLRAIPGRENVPFLMVTATGERELRREALRLGALGFLTKPVDPVEFLALATNVIAGDRARRDAVARADENAARARKLETELADRDAQLVDALAVAIQARDPRLADEAQRVGALAMRLARRLGLAASERELLDSAVRLYDIGKIALPDRILSGQRPEPGDPLLVRDHPAYARAILGTISDDAPPGSVLRAAMAIATTHHEHWDGSGYPAALRGEAIPLYGRIVAVADAYCELTAQRSGRPPASPGHALASIESGRGTAYDPRIVVALRETLAEAS